MGGHVRSKLVSRLSSAAASATGVLTLGALLTGCSADITRFDYPAFGLTSDNPRARAAPPTPSEYIPYAPPQTASPGGAYPAPAPDYGGFSDNASGSQKYTYRGPAPANAYNSQSYSVAGGNAVYGNANMAADANGFGTVPGQPESYNPGQYASNGRTSYVMAPGEVSAPAMGAPNPPYASKMGSGFAQPGAPAGQIVPPVADAQPVFTGRRPKPGTMVEVLPGESLYQVARRNGVSVAALMQVNRLHSPVVQSGQKLMMPGRGGRSILPPIAPQVAGAPVLSGPSMASDTDPDSTPPEPASGFVPAPPAAAAMASAIDTRFDNKDGTYTVRAGDSIYSIAGKHGVKPEDIAAANGLKDVTKVNYGQTLRMPGTVKAPLAGATFKPASGARVAALLPGKTATPAGNAPAPVLNDADMDGAPDSAGEAMPQGNNSGVEATNSSPILAPKMNSPAAKAAPFGKLATAAPAAGVPLDPASRKLSAADAAPPADMPSDGRFRWPVRGRIIGQFGPTGKAGQANEGIDLAVPQGTEVHAAENGVVAYAGDELKGYGKLILIRHADNWVTAYAHNDELLVKRGDAIRRGQVISKSGKSGGVDQPLLHFELRKGSQPIDPMPHMASN